MGGGGGGTRQCRHRPHHAHQRIPEGGRRERWPRATPERSGVGHSSDDPTHHVSKSNGKRPTECSYDTTGRRAAGGRPPRRPTHGTPRPRGSGQSGIVLFCSACCATAEVLSGWLSLGPVCSRLRPAGMGRGRGWSEPGWSSQYDSLLTSFSISLSLSPIKPRPEVRSGVTRSQPRGTTGPLLGDITVASASAHASFAARRAYKIQQKFH